MASSTQDLVPTRASSVLKLSEIQQHNTKDDCWIVVHSKVWDVSSFHASHPGGSAIILKYAGGDATEAYNNIHAPGILEDTLAQDQFKGLIAQEDIKSAQAAAELPLEQPVVESSTTPIAEKYVKPDLFKLISVHDFEEVALKTFSPKAFAFFSSAATDLVTHRNNSDFYSKIMIRPRVMRNVKDVSIKRSILGCDSSAPFFVSPAAMARLAHPDGELALSQGCGAQDIIQVVCAFFLTATALVVLII